MAWPALSFADWKPVPRAVAFFALAFYTLFLLYAAVDRSGFLVLDYLNLAIHEAGHPLFQMFSSGDQASFGYLLGIVGGTLLELTVPLACVFAFFLRRDTSGAAFCSFWFFENFLYIGHYMATARTMDVELVGSGDHDWEILFTRFNLLVRDQQIGHATRALGWLGMLAVVAWFSWRCLRRPWDLRSAGDAGQLTSKFNS
jgi:hypothetical protein